MKMGAYARLFVPISVLIVAVVAVRYTLLVDSEATLARHQLVLESRQVTQGLTEAVTPLVLADDRRAIAALMQRAADVNAAVARIRWLDDRGALVATRLPESPAYPGWFARVTGLGPLTYTVPIGPAGARMELWFSATPALNVVWRAMGRQALVTCLNVFLVYFLLGLLIYATRRMLRRVGRATQAFRDGQYHVRLPVRGFPEAQAVAITFNDMAARIQELMQTLQSEKERSEVTLASIGDAVIVTDPCGRVESMNETAQTLTGYAPAEARGLELHEVFTLANNFGQHTLMKTLAAVQAGGPVVKAKDQNLRHRDGRRFNVEYTAAPIRKAGGGLHGTVLVFRDVSETRQLIQQMSWRSYHDVLTGLPNRAALAGRFDQEIARAQAGGALLAVCLFDLDHFRQVNDSGGHALGDEVLKQVASRLHDFAGNDHYVARLGGDEFVLLLRDHGDRAGVERTLERLMLALTRPYLAGSRTVPLTASVGVAVYKGSDVSADHLLRHADQALYQAKVQGRRKVHFFDADLDEQVRTHHNRRTEVREALLAGQLVPFYQPKVDMRHGRVVGMEALLRWRHPARGLLGPGEFLPAVEHTDLIADIGEWVLRQALEQLAEWCAAGRMWGVSVNIAARHFQRADFVQQLRAILEEYPAVPPRLLELEILESSALHDVNHVRCIMQECQAMGIRFALDDFGTGYSSMAYLKRLPADVLKVDQSFVRNMLVDRDDLHLVSAVVGLARAFNRSVIAEGVETAAHGALLIRLGCDLAQGYGIARPMPAEDVLDWAAGFVKAPAWEDASLLGPLTDLRGDLRSFNLDVNLSTPA
ncbi:putative bifunctional diguanylate cyclase/phosphodiesterase [Pseudoduganella armeniaca]|nr:GGDEF domain-containing phosphodiesterase [Pseudoduganella armeniaca]